MHRIRLYPQHSYRSYGNYGGYAPHYSLHVVNTPWNTRRRRINAQRASFQQQITLARLQARLQAQYGFNSISSPQSLSTNPGVYGQSMYTFPSAYGGYGQSPYSGYSAPAMGLSSYSNAISGYGNGAWSTPYAGLASSYAYQPAFGY